MTLAAFRGPPNTAKQPLRLVDHRGSARRARLCEVRLDLDSATLHTFTTHHEAASKLLRHLPVEEMLKVYTPSSQLRRLEHRRRSRVVMDEQRDAVEFDPTSLGTFIGKTGKASLDAGDLHPVP